MPGLVGRGVAALLLLWPLLAPAQKGVDYRAVGDSPAILYDAPSLRAKKLFVAPRGMPLEVVVSALRIAVATALETERDIPTGAGAIS